MQVRSIISSPNASATASQHKIVTIMCPNHAKNVMALFLSFELRMYQGASQERSCSWEGDAYFASSDPLITPVNSVTLCLRHGTAASNASGWMSLSENRLSKVDSTFALCMYYAVIYMLFMQFVSAAKACFQRNCRVILKKTSVPCKFAQNSLWWVFCFYFPQE